MRLPDHRLLELRQYAITVLHGGNEKLKRELAASALAAIVKALIDRELVRRGLTTTNPNKA